MPLAPTERHYVKDWPADLVQIAEVVGVECAELIARNLGGHEMRFGQHTSARRPPANRLSVLIGVERYRQLAQHFTQGIGSLKFTLPAGPFLSVNRDQRMRDDLYWDAVETYRSAPQIATHVGVTTRTVRRWMRKHGITAADLKSNLKETDR